MNNKLKRVVAIIALILISVFTVTFILYIFDKTMLNGAIGDLALWSGAFGLLLVLVLWISRSFPAQQIKDEERERLYKEAEEMEEERLRKLQEECNESAEDAEKETPRIVDETNESTDNQ